MSHEARVTGSRPRRSPALVAGYGLLAAVGAALVAYAGGRSLWLMSGLLLVLLAAAGLVLLAFDAWYRGHRPGLTVATAPSGVSATAFLRSPLTTVMSVAFCVLITAWSVAGLAVTDADGNPIIFLAPAVLGLAPLTAVVTGKIAAGGLYLTPDGIEQRKEAISWALPWDRVAGVVAGEPLVIRLDGPPPQPTFRTRWLWRREPAGPPGTLAVDSRYLAEDPAVVADVIERCVADPALRARLGTPEVAADIRPD